MTAPLAWFYAIPSSVSARRRGDLVQPVDIEDCLRLASDFNHARDFGAVPCALVGRDLCRRAVGAAVMLAVLSFTPLPLFSIMGGIRLSEGNESLLRSRLA